MIDQDFFAVMALGIPPIPPPAAHRCECDPSNHNQCDDCEAVDHALRQYAPNEDQPS